MTTIAEYLQARCPHTFSALHHLVRAMTRVCDLRGKRTLFGKDKCLIAHEEFQRRVRDTMLAMLLDGMIETDSQPGLVRQMFCTVIYQFGQAFPEWEEAYEFAGDYFAGNPEAAEDRIQTLMGSNELAIGFAPPAPSLRGSQSRF